MEKGFLRLLIFDSNVYPLATRAKIIDKIHKPWDEFVMHVIRESTCVPLAKGQY